MSTEKCQKNAEIFFCEKCAFRCSKQSNYIKHLNTAKHKNQQNQQKKCQKMPKNADTHNSHNSIICECGKNYKDRSGLWRHKKVCKYINKTAIIEIEEGELETEYNIENTKNSEILSLISQNKELMDLLHEQNKIIKEIVPKIGNNNSTTNNTTNNNFNLNVFLNEDCKDAINFSDFIDNIKISFEDLEHQSHVGFVNGISKLFIENLQELGTYKRPIHCTDKKRKTIYIKGNNGWDKEGSQETLKRGINKLTIKTQEKLIKEKEENREEYADLESEFSGKCISIQRNLYPDYPHYTSINKVIEKISQNSSIIDKVQN